MAAKKKLTLYVSDEVLKETKQEALRQDRSISWVLETAWRMSRNKIQDFPSIEDFHSALENAS